MQQPRASGRPDASVRDLRNLRHAPIACRIQASRGAVQNRAFGAEAFYACHQTKTTTRDHAGASTAGNYQRGSAGEPPQEQKSKEPPMNVTPTVPVMPNIISDIS